MNERTPATSPEVLAAGYARCAEVTREHGTTYYWGARLLPVEAKALVAAIDLIGDHMPEGTRCTPPEGGFFMWLELPEGMDADALLPVAQEAGVIYVAGSACFQEGHRNTLRLAYSGVSPEEITIGISLGYTMALAGSAELDHMMASADKASYRAKRNGGGIDRELPPTLDLGRFSLVA